MSNRFFWSLFTSLAAVLVALLLMAATAPAGQATYAVSRITCGACSENISQGLQNCPGVASVQVDVATRTVQVGFDPAVTDAGEVAQALGRLGYPGTLVGVGAGASSATPARGGCGSGCCDKSKPL